MPSKTPPTPRCDDLRKTFDAFKAMPPTSNVHWEEMVRKVELALTGAASKLAEFKTAGDTLAVKTTTADFECLTKLKAEVRRAQEDWNAGQKTR